MGGVVVPQLVGAFPDSMVRVAVDRDAVHREVAQRTRFDVVVADLIWNGPEMEFDFDGLDVVDVVFSVFHEAAGTDHLPPLIRDAAIGKRRNGPLATTRGKPLYELFRGRRGETAGRDGRGHRGRTRERWRVPCPGGGVWRSTPRRRSRRIIWAPSSRSAVSTTPGCR